MITQLYGLSGDCLRRAKIGFAVSVLSAFHLSHAQATDPALSETVATQIPGRDLRTHPPAVQSLAITPLGQSAGGNSGLLKVRFREAGLPARLQFIYQGAIHILRDDGLDGDKAGDGEYTARVDLEPDLAEAQSQIGLRASARASALSLAGSSDEPSLAALASSSDLDPGKTLLVRDTSVVNDPARTSDPCLSSNPADSAKKWTFGYALTQMANQAVTRISPNTLARSLIRNWETNQTINGDLVPARTNIKAVILDKWLRASGNTGVLAMNKAPFRLLAIVNRVDLRQNLFFGEGLAGEFRFVWGLVDLESTNADGSCRENGSFALIMEYAVDKADPEEVKAYGQRWVDLNDLALGSPEYRSGLEAITESVVRAGVGQARNRANGSALIRIRTNEIALAGPWELREFNISPAGTRSKGNFIQVEAKQTPANVNNGTAQVAEWINANAAAILAGTYNVPSTFQGSPFRGGHSLNNIDFWNGPGIADNQARHVFSMGTCNGCHGREADVGFLHIQNRTRTRASNLSGFLQGTIVTDPVDGTERAMNDLERRAADLFELTSSSTLSSLSFQPTSRTH
jgi:hypothetical protein